MAFDRQGDERVAFRTCPLCEATCGIAITLRDDQVVDIRGDDDDPFSRGYICPKATTLGALHEDPDRLRAPLVKRDGAFVETSWEQAFAEVQRRLMPIIEEHGRDAVGVYVGNPNVHNLDSVLFLKPFIKALGTKNVYSASTIDQRPKELASALMFGSPLTVAVPDIDHTAYLMILGANPFESNGSLATAPDWPGRIKAIRRRGGKVVVVDPRRTLTARNADEHVAIRPGGDALLLAAIAHTLFSENLVRLGASEGIINGLDQVRSAVQPFVPEKVAAHTGIDAATIRRLARELATAESAAVYGRLGTTTQAFGTLSSWLVDVANILTGNLDRAGGAMFTKAAAGASNTRGTPRTGREVRIGRWRSRVRGLPETFGELPVACLAEEIDTPGEGRIRALITVAGNPAVSAPDAGRLDRAMATLDLMVSVDIYRNETTRHADIIFPPPSALERSHYDLAFYQLSVRNVAKYTPPVLSSILPSGADRPAEWQILARLALIAQGAGADADPRVADDFVVQALIEAAVRDQTSNVAGREASEILSMLQPRQGPERLLDLMLRTGPYGDGFGAKPDGLTLATLEQNPHGVDLGPLQPRLPDALRTPSGMIECAPQPCLDDLPRLVAALDVPVNGQMVLIGRRHVRSNNSWLHNIPSMVKGKDRCTLLVHPDDAARLGLKDGQPACVTSNAGTVDASVEVSDEMRPGVVSLPHGWGHAGAGLQMAVAEANAGVNSNVLTDSAGIDAVSGNAILNGIPVTVVPR